MSQPPRGDSREIAIVAKSDISNTIVVIEANPTTKALKVDATESGDVPVTLDGEALTIKDGDSSTLLDIESDGSKNAAYVQANDLDIRDLSSASDSVAVPEPIGINGAPVTVGTTAVEMTFTGTTRSITLMSDADNTGKVWFGLSNVDNTGANAFGRLTPDRAVTLELNDSSAAIYAVSDTASQTVYKVALT